MRCIFLPLLLATTLPVVAHASTIDDFVLTGEGNTITFSLPASPNASPVYGAGGVDGGFFASTSATINDVISPVTIQFLSTHLSYIGPGLTFSSPDGSFTIVGALLYSGTSAAPTFDTGTFNLHDFYGSSDPYLLTITPESSTPESSDVPEPSTLVLLGTGIFGLIGAARRKITQV